MPTITTRALLGATVLASVAFAATPASAQRVDRIVAFGDSYADDGNFFELAGINPATGTSGIYPTGRFSGGTNYVDTLGTILGVPIDNFAIGGALTNNTNTNGPLPGFTFEYTSFLAGGGGVFPTVSGTFDKSDLVTVSVGGNDARLYQRTGGSLAGAPAAATASAAFATTGLDALVGAGARTISFLAGDTGLLPEIANNPAGAAIRSAYSSTFNAAVQDSLAGYAANGVMVHYLDLSAVLANVSANPEAYGITNGLVCPAFPPPAGPGGDPNFATCIVNAGDGYLFYGDFLHLTSDGFDIVGRYVAAQLQAPLTLAGPSEVGHATARQFGRTLNSRMDLGAPRDGETAEGLKFFITGDTFSRDVRQTASTDAFDVDGVGGTVGAEMGFGNSVIGAAVNYTRGRANFAGGPSRDRLRSLQLGAYAAYAVGPAFIQGHVGYGWDKHRIKREGVVEDLRASPKGNHWTAGAKAGFLMNAGAVRVGPIGGLDYTRAKVDGYTESGDPALTLNVGRQRLKSFTANLGLEARTDLDSGGLSLRPFLNAVIERSFSNNNRVATFAQTSAPTIVNSWEIGRESNEAYGRLTGGASAELFGSTSLDAQVSSTFGRNDGNDVSAQVGLRIGF